MNIAAATQKASFGRENGAEGASMAGISGIDNMTAAQIVEEVGRGGRFVYFQYCVSVLVLTFRRSSPIFFVKAGESRVVKSLPYSLSSLVLGWWGFPWGFIYTPAVLAKNFAGGEDITDKVMASMAAPRPDQAR
jgi:hypothetical protein